MSRMMGFLAGCLVLCQASLGAEQRTWTTKKGQTFEAAYLRDSGDKVFMQKPDGRQAIISLAALTEADQTYIAEHRGDAMKPPEVDPFADIKPRAVEPSEDGTAVTFTYSNPDAKEVKLAGDFNKFSGELMESDGAGTWTKSVDLTPGKHEYKFIVDGNWIFDPNNDARQKTTKHENSVIDVQAPAESAAAAE